MALGRLGGGVDGTVHRSEGVVPVLVLNGSFPKNGNKRAIEFGSLTRWSLL